MNHFETLGLEKFVTNMFVGTSALTISHFTERGMELLP
jgi:hypothetical protein